MAEISYPPPRHGSTRRRSGSGPSQRVPGIVVELYPSRLGGTAFSSRGLIAAAITPPLPAGPMTVGPWSYRRIEDVGQHSSSWGVPPLMCDVQRPTVEQGWNRRRASGRTKAVEGGTAALGVLFFTAIQKHRWPGELEGNPSSLLPRPGGFGRPLGRRGLNQQVNKIRTEHTISGAEWRMNPKTAQIGQSKGGNT